MKTLVSTHEILKKHLSTGCDERIYLNDEGLVRYWIDLMDTSIINRGSCTCSPLSEESKKDLYYLLENNDFTNEEDFNDLIDKHTKELKSFINYEGEDGFEIFYGASGTDLIYLSLIFAKMLNPSKPILNLVTCLEELGSGAVKAVYGQYHVSNNQFEEPLPVGEIIDESLKLNVISHKARTENGQIIDQEKNITDNIKQYDDHSIIINLVFGSKSGIKDDLDIVDKLNRPDIMYNIDMCQLRHKKDIINDLLNKNGLVMITGSKFYNSPPFCGAMLVPKFIYKKLINADWSCFDKFDKVFSKYDFPEKIRKYINHPNKMNVALQLRWACALEEIKRFKKEPVDKVNNKIELWNSLVIKELQKYDCFEVMPGHELTNKTIVSFRVLKDGQYLDHPQLQALHKSVVKVDYSGSYDFKTVFIGQPVAFENKSFLRFAIGSVNVREFIRNDEKEFNTDKAIISIIKEKIGSFDLNE